MGFRILKLVRTDGKYIFSVALFVRYSTSCAAGRAPPVTAYVPLQSVASDVHLNSFRGKYVLRAPWRCQRDVLADAAATEG